MNEIITIGSRNLCSVRNRGLPCLNVLDTSLGCPHLMLWTAPTRRHLGAKMVVFMNHREIGAVHERNYHDRC